MKKQKAYPTILLNPHHFIQVRRRRIFAFLIDLLPIVFFEIAHLIFVAEINITEHVPPQPNSNTLVNIFSILLLIYFGVLSFQMSRSKFATLGMRLMKLSAVTKSGNRPNFLNTFAHYFTMLITFTILEAIVSGALKNALQTSINTIILFSIILVISYIYMQPNHVKWMHKPYLQDFFSKLTFIRTDTKYSDV